MTVSQLKKELYLGRKLISYPFYIKERHHNANSQLIVYDTDFNSPKLRQVVEVHSTYVMLSREGLPPSRLEFPKANELFDYPNGFKIDNNYPESKDCYLIYTFIKE
jgi:hypothetical protein